MSQYETDEEKVETIRRWFKENGLAVVVGVAIGLGAILGWRAWNNYQDGIAQQASAAFEKLLATAGAGTDRAAARQQAEGLRLDFAKTPYAALGSLVEARLALASGDLAGARQALERGLASAPEPALARIAALRLARILMAQKDLAGALAIIEAHDDKGAFTGEFAALRGDIAAAQGDPQRAREAYQQALAAGASQAQLIQIKLDNLPAAG